MSKKRVHELAKELGMDNREVVLALQAAGISVKTHSSSVYEEEALAVLNKVKGAEPAAAAPTRRPGMVIVKKRRDGDGSDASSDGVTSTTADDISSPGETPEPSHAAAPVIIKKQQQPQVEENPAEEAPQEEPVPQVAAPVTPPPAPVQMPQASASASPVHTSTSSEAQPVSQSPAPQNPSRVEQHKGAELQGPARSYEGGHRRGPEVTRRPDNRAPQHGQGGAPQDRGGQRPSYPQQHQGQGGQRPYQGQHQGQRPSGPTGANAPGRDREQGNQPAAQDQNAGAKPGEASTPVNRRPQPTTTSATVVRMIDRDKLLERVPGRRLGGGGGGGAAGQRYGQVTELKVVTDPFGRGREMVAVGRDKKKALPGAPGAGPLGKGAPVRKGPGGRPGKRDMDMRERSMYPSRLKKKKTNKRAAKKTEVTQPKASKRVIKMKETIVVTDLAHQLGIKAVDIVRKLMGMGMMVTQNQTVDFDTATLIASEYEYTVESVAFAEGALIADVAQAEEAEENLQNRPPVVTVMGHVDHGKTSLLDAIRRARVAAGEAGGITQHIGAYQVVVPKKGTITFLDTPGHAAFTSMRARGAKITDLVVLVVAADDGVMPQTEEAIKHAQAAEVPIIVAVNKIDKPEANAERVMQELTKYELVPEAWGGDTLYVNTSATKGTGIKELLDSILLQSEVLELKANPDRAATGVVIEAQLDKGRGPVATVLVQRGTLKRGDAIVVGSCSGKIRAMMDDQGRQLTEAGPSAAVEVTGLDLVPEAGDTLNAVESAEVARNIAEHRLASKRSAEQSAGSAMSLDDLMKRMEGQGQLELKVVLKADVQGSVEAVKGALLNLSTDEVKVNVIYGGAGGIKESDVMLAAASRGLVLGFGVRPDSNARMVAEKEGVEIRTYNIIYEAVDDIRAAMEGLLKPESREKIIGRAEVRELFRVSKVGVIGGCRVTEGKAMRSARVRVLRDSVQVYDGKVASLRHFKNDVREVESGLECGVGVEGYNDIKMGDVIEFYTTEEIARTLGQSSGGGKRPNGGGNGVEAHP